MSKLKHTPGPWRIIEGNWDHEITNDYRIDESYGEICKMQLDFEGFMGVEQKANARLIATAPEMLDFMIKSCLESIEMWKEQFDDEDYSELFNEWKKLNIEKANIIEKATGLPIEEVLR